eukprot:PhF_6_TR32393/c0_g1_i1/m.48057
MKTPVIACNSLVLLITAIVLLSDSFSSSSNTSSHLQQSSRTTNSNVTTVLDHHYDNNVFSNSKQAITEPPPLVVNVTTSMSTPSPCQNNTGDLVVGNGTWNGTDFIEEEEGCFRRPPLTQDSLIQCMKNKRILMVGHSHLRSMFRDILNILGHNVTRLDHRLTRHMSTSFINTTWNYRVDLIFAWKTESIQHQSFYDDENGMNTTTTTNTTTYDVVFTMVGMYQLLFMDLDPSSTIEYFVNYFNRVHELFRAHKYVAINMYDLNQAARNYKINKCFTPDRVSAYQAMFRCALSLSVLGRVAWYVDVSAITRNTPQFVEHDGNHYSLGSPVLKEIGKVIQQVLVMPLSVGGKKLLIMDRVWDFQNHLCFVPPYRTHTICKVSLIPPPTTTPKKGRDRKRSRA